MVHVEIEEHLALFIGRVQDSQSNYFFDHEEDKNKLFCSVSNCLSNERRHTPDVSKFTNTNMTSYPVMFRDA
jgi:hypothetical protein